MNKIELQRLNTNFVEASKEIGAYLRCDVGAPKEINKKFKEALSELREFLDYNNIKMPSPKWIFDETDKKTWPYLDVIIGTDKKGKTFNGVKINPDFKFKHLL